MHNLDLILTLTGGLGAALVLGYATQRLGLSPIVGYLLAGTLVGPHTPGFVADAGMAEQLAEIGVVLLMFGVGLQFHLEELLAVRRVALPGAILQSLVATGLGWAVARTFGWDDSAGIVFGMTLAVASTVVLVRVLADNRDLHTRAGHIAIGWLVVEDLFTVLVLVLLPSLAGGAGGSPALLKALGVTAIKVTGLVAFTAIVGTRAIPWLLDRVAATRSRELFTLTVLVLALGIAVGASLIFGVSMALGAFLAGMVVGRSDYSVRAASDALPMRDAFAVLFFVSVGMLLDPGYLLREPALIGAALAVVLIGKPLVAFVVVRVLQYPLRASLGVAVALSQIGEFSFILAELGRQLGVLEHQAMNAVVAVSMISIVVNPLMYRAVRPVERWVLERPRLARVLDGRQPPDGRAEEGELPAHTASLDARHLAVVIGYGPVGRTVTRLLRDNDVAPVVVELNMETVRGLRDAGVAAVYGDAAQVDTLRKAGVDRAASLILSADSERSGEIIRLAREMNPTVRVLARTAYLRGRRELENAGANGVFSGEGEVALALTEAILSRLGATPEQMDRERSRVRAELA